MRRRYKIIMWSLVSACVALSIFSLVMTILLAGDLTYTILTITFSINAVNIALQGKITERRLANQARRRARNDFYARPVIADTIEDEEVVRRLDAR